ncbi:unnamed protein product, partial [Lymnaea stagnalis]
QKRTSYDYEPTIGGAPKKAKKSSFIPLPDELARTGALVNVRNTDDEECFKWSVLAALHPHVNDPKDVHSYLDYENELNFAGLTFPMNRSNIPQFEKQNQIRVNLFGYDNNNRKRKTIFPVMVSKETQERLVELLCITNDNTAHYSWIKQFSALMGDTDQHYCRYCLGGFEGEELLKNHMRLCQLLEPQKVDFPSGLDAILSDKYPEIILQAPYVIYADFECIQPRVQGSSDDEADRKLIKLTDHQPSGYAYKVVGPVDEATQSVVVYRGQNVVENFMDAIHEENERIKKLRKKTWKTNKATVLDICYICKDELPSPKDIYVSPNEEYLGNLCWKCSPKYNEEVIVVFHNLTNYDGHFIMADRKTAENCKFCISSSINTYSSFTIGSIKFIDSLSFVKDSLANLVS